MPDETVAVATEQMENTPSVEYQNAMASGESRLAALLESDPAPLPCEDSELAAVDFTRMDVLIGTVRSDEQFDYCMESRSYYVPAKTVTPADLPVTVIALYEEGLTRRAGIKRYGRVTDTRVVKRSDIPVPMKIGRAHV